MTWMRLFAILSKYYGFMPDILNEMTLYQFFGYFREISEVENLFSGAETPATDDEILEDAKKFRLKPPRSK